MQSNAAITTATHPPATLIDPDAALAKAGAADLADANVSARPARMWAGSPADAAGAAIAVITAEANRVHLMTLVAARHAGRAALDALGTPVPA